MKTLFDLRLQYRMDRGEYAGEQSQEEFYFTNPDYCPWLEAKVLENMNSLEEAGKLLNHISSRSCSCDGKTCGAQDRH
jgi:hypothetical protein